MLKNYLKMEIYKYRKGIKNETNIMECKWNKSMCK